MDYQNYKTEDFVLDPDFRKWVLTPEKDTNLFWEKWIANHSDKVVEIRKAREILLNLSRKKYLADDVQENEVWEEIEKQISYNTKPSFNVIPLGPHSIIEKYSNKKQLRFSPLKIAATISILLISTVLFIYQQGQVDQISSEKLVTKIEKINPRGQRSSLVLPDGTKVILNRESKLTYTEEFNKTRRIVYLEGEAFFEVKKDFTKPFVVKTKNLNTTALGTSFNVKVSQVTGDVKVSLVTGKVLVKNNIDIDSLENQVILLPGEQLSFTELNQLFDKSDFNLEEVMGWSKGILIFKSIPQNEVFEELEKWFGVDIEFNSYSLSNSLVTAKFDNKSLESILESLSYTLDFNYQLQDKKVNIQFK